MRTNTVTVHVSDRKAAAKNKVIALIHTDVDAAPALGARHAVSWRWMLVLLSISAILIRSRYFGNPTIDADEEFYLLVGDRLLHGALPYVDIWDRKPIGLFLLYAGMRLLGGDGVLQYQIVAALFVAATACTIATLARRVATPGAAWAAGLAYVPALALSGGAGGQTPVFYNLPVALAMHIGLRLWSGQGEKAARLHGVGAMLLIGLAIQIKYTAVFEGIFLGCILLWIDRRGDLNRRSRAINAILWILAALTPTIVASMFYIMLGHEKEFFYANFGSIFARSDHLEVSSAAKLLGKTVVKLSPFIIMIVLSEWLLRDWVPWRRDKKKREAHTFLLCWLGAALFGYLIFGGYFNHYALPLLPPLALLSAPAFSISRRYIGVGLAAITLLALLVPAYVNARKLEKRRGSPAYTYHLANMIRQNLNGGCLYVFYGEPVLYHLTQACLPSRWPFPYHLSLTREALALGVDPLREERRILDSRPTIIIDRLTDDPEINIPVQTLLRQRLARDYHLLLSTTHATAKSSETDQVWQLNSSTPARPAA